LEKNDLYRGGLMKKNRLPAFHVSLSSLSSLSFVIPLFSFLWLAACGFFWSKLGCSPTSIATTSQTNT
jgi:hypothetical protein